MPVPQADQAEPGAAALWDATELTGIWSGSLSISMRALPRHRSVIAPLAPSMSAL
jgi:hypothetical protein